MCDRSTNLTDPTADFVLSDLLTATEDLIDFCINVLDTIRLQTHFNDRNRRVNLGVQLQEVSEGQKNDASPMDIRNKACVVTTTLKYDLSLYLDRVLQACKRTKANLLLLRVSRTRATNSSLLLVASTHVRVEQLNRKVQLLTRLVKENGGEFPKKPKKKKIEPSQTQLETEATAIKDESVEPKPEKKPAAEKKPSINLLSKEDLVDYVEIALSFRMLINKYREFIQHVRDAARASLASNGQAALSNSIVLIPIAANAIDELNNILNRLVRIAFAIEAESNYLRQPPPIFNSTENKELYRQGTNKTNKDEGSFDETGSLHQLVSTERLPSSRPTTPRTTDAGATQRESNMRRSDFKSTIRNQSAMASSSSSMLNLAHPSDVQSFKLTPNMIANIFEDFFLDTKD